MVLAKSSVLQVAFEVDVQASLAAFAVQLAEFSELANAAGSRGTSTVYIFNRIVILSDLADIDLHYSGSKSTPTILPSTETSFPLIHFPPCEPSDLIFDLSSVQ